MGILNYHINICQPHKDFESLRHLSLFLFAWQIPISSSQCKDVYTKLSYLNLSVMPTYFLPLLFQPYTWRNLPTEMGVAIVSLLFIFKPFTLIMPANRWHVVVNRQLPNQDVSLALTTLFSHVAYSYLYPVHVCKTLDCV